MILYINPTAMPGIHYSPQNQGVSVGHVEDYYASRESAVQDSRAQSYEQKVREIQEMLPKVAAHFSENPPEISVEWVWLNGQKRVGWTVAGFHSGNEQYDHLCLLSDGTLVSTSTSGSHAQPARAMQTFVLQYGKGENELDDQRVTVLHRGLSERLPQPSSPPKGRWWKRVLGL